jgi:hypothetical protein
MISTKGTKDETREFTTKYITPGVHEVKITNVTATEVESGSSYLTFSFENKTGQTVETRLYVSENAKNYTLGKIKHMGTKVIDETTLDSVTGKNWAEYAKNLTRAISNKMFRIKFSGEMVAGGINPEGEKKKDWAKTMIPHYDSGKTPPFAEKLTTVPSRLVYDPTNKFDLKPLETANTETTTYKNNGQNDKFPF